MDLLRALGELAKATVEDADLAIVQRADQGSIQSGEPRKQLDVERVPARSRRQQRAAMVVRVDAAPDQLLAEQRAKADGNACSVDARAAHERGRGHRAALDDGGQQAPFEPRNAVAAFAQPDCGRAAKRNDALQAVVEEIIMLA